MPQAEIIRAGSVVIWDTPAAAIKTAALRLADQYHGSHVQIEVHVDKPGQIAKINVRDINVPD